MGKLAKIIGVFVALGVLLVGAAALILPRFLEPDALKSHLIAEAKARTGRDLDLAGDIQLSVFPWLGLELGAARLGNAAGFGEGPFASVEAVDVRVKLLPLLRKEIEMSTVRLEGLRLHLARDAKGRANWADLGGQGKDASAQAPAEASAESAGAVAAFAVSGVVIKDAEIHWQDRQAGSDYRLTALDLDTGPLGDGQPVDLKLSFALQDGQGGLDERIELTTRLQADLGAQTYDARDLRLAWTRAAGMTAELSADLAVEMAAQTLTLSGARLTAAGLTASGDVQGQRIQDAPSFSGAWQIDEFSPRGLLAGLDVAVPDTADPAVLTRASARFDLQADTRTAQLKGLQVRLDDTQLTGELSINDFTKPSYGFQAVIDQFDLDRYLPPPPPKDAAPATPGAASAGAATALPLDTLRALRINGQLQIGQLKAYGLRSSEVSLTIKARDGDIRVSPASAALYQGRYQGDIGLNAAGKEARLTVNERFTGIQVGDMLNDLQGKQRLSGTGDMSFRLNTRGTDVSAFRRHLNGNAAFNFRDGAVEGINIGRLVSQAQAALKGQTSGGDTGADRTDFSELSGTAVFTDGVARNEDLLGKSPFLRVTGAGTADLANSEMDYGLKVVIVGTHKGQGGRELEELRGVPIPLRISGPFADLKYRVDLQAALQDAVRAKVEEKVEEQKEKLQEKIQEQVGDKLKGLFGR